MTYIRLPKKNQILSSTSVSGAYTATVSDDILLADTSGGALTITLAPAADAEGRTLTVQKTSTSDFNKLTVDGSGAETINGDASIYLFGANEAVTIYSNGTSWTVIDWTESDVMSYTPTLPSATNVDQNTCYVKFQKQYMYGSGIFSFIGTPASGAQAIVTLPSGPVFDTDKLPAGTNATNTLFSVVTTEAKWFNIAAWTEVYAYYISSTTFGFRQAPGVVTWSAMSNTESISYNVYIPVK